jgi:hypothetical protein
MATKKRAKYLKPGVELGDRVRDQVSGFTGIATSITRWLNGCVRVGIESEKLEKGKIGESYTIDATQLVVVKRAVVPAFQGEQGPGGPRPVPKAWPDRR